MSRNEQECFFCLSMIHLVLGACYSALFLARLFAKCSSIYSSGQRRSEFRILPFGFLKDGNIGIGIFP